MAKRRSKQYESLLKEYRREAKKADQRLVRLERLSEQEHFKGVKKMAYARAQRDIKQWSGEGASRFNTKPPETVQGLKAKLQDIKFFLYESKTSRKSDIIKYYKERQQTVLEKYGLNMSWQDAAKYYEQNINEKFDSKYGSQTALVAMAVIKKNKKQIQNDITRAKHVRMVEDKVVDRAVKDMLENYSEELQSIGVL